MYAKLHRAMVYGIDGIIVEVEVDIHNGLPGWGSLQVLPEIREGEEARDLAVSGVRDG
jgi:hypothetical protein